MAENDSNQRGSLRTVKRASLEEQVYRTLRTAILNQELAGNTRLVQEEVAARLGTSRIPVRDALRKLETEGLVEADARGTYHVASFGVEDVQEVYGMRLLLEPYAAVLALKQLSPGVLEELAEHNRHMATAATAGDIDLYITLNYNFHILLYETSGQRRLVQVIKRLWLGLPALTPLTVAGQLERSVKEHDALLAALTAGDRELVEQTLISHIRNAGDALTSELRQHTARE